MFASIRSISRSSDDESRACLRYSLMSAVEELSPLSVSVTKVRTCRVAACASSMALCSSSPVAEIEKIGEPEIGVAESRSRTSPGSRPRRLATGSTISSLVTMRLYDDARACAPCTYPGSACTRTSVRPTLIVAVDEYSGLRVVET